MFTTLDISSSALQTNRVRMQLIANNLANINTTRDEFGRPNPFRKKLAIFKTGGVGPKAQWGVHIPRLIEDNKAPHMVYDPGHPDANKEGYVAMPNITVIEEMVDMIAATRAYEANVTVMESTKSMMTTSLRILA